MPLFLVQMWKCGIGHVQDMRKCENAKKGRGHGLGKVTEETFSHFHIFTYKNVVVYFQKAEHGC